MLFLLYCRVLAYNLEFSITDGKSEICTDSVIPYLNLADISTVIKTMINSFTKKSYSIHSEWTAVKEPTHGENSMTLAVVNKDNAIDCKDINRAKLQTDIKALWEKQSGQ
jgi:hypothetical protein